MREISRERIRWKRGRKREINRIRGREGGNEGDIEIKREKERLDFGLKSSQSLNEVTIILFFSFSKQEVNKTRGKYLIVEVCIFLRKRTGYKLEVPSEKKLFVVY